jgi:hypothetical protein
MSSALRHSKETLTVGYIPQSVAALQEVDANTGEEDSVVASRPVVFPRPSSIGSAKGHRRCKLSVGLTMVKTPLLKVVPVHG